MANLLWDACYNVRDLGGLPTTGGRRTRSHALIRSDILARLASAGKQALIDYGVATVIDLRWPGEVAEEPSAFAMGRPQPGEPAYRILPVENRNSPDIEQIDSAPTQAEKYTLTLDLCQSELAEIVGAVAVAPAGGVLFHCHAGKDRTGIVAALLLGLVGVPDGVIAADYAASEARLWPLFRRMQADAAGDPARLAALQHKIPTALPETMLAVLAHLRNRYGGVRAYLLRAGLTETALARIEDRFLED